MHCDVSRCVWVQFYNRTFFAFASTCGKRKSQLSATLYDSEYDGKGLARLCSTNSVEPIAQENIASSVSVENKAICRSSKQKHLRMR